MKNFKKIMALIIAMVMVVGTMSMAVMADTAGDLTPDSEITITGLDEGDTVHLYQILRWVENDGWRLVENPDYSALTTTGDANYCQKVVNLINNVPNTTLDKADLEKIANVVKGTDVVDEETIDESPYTYTTTQAPGMYIALVTPGQAGVIYNPIVVSSDFSNTPDTSEINASTATMGTSSVAKKETITVTKTAEEQSSEDPKTNNAHDVGDIVKFTVTTKIPAYSDSYVNPSFKISDTLSNGLKMVVDDDHPFTVVAGTMAYAVNAEYAGNSDPGAPQTDDVSFYIDFKKSDTEDTGLTPSKIDSVAELIDYQDVTITYYAKITGDCATNVTEEQNTVTVEFSNNPNDTTGADKGTIKDKTKHYTFTIDGSLLGETAYKNSELVKVGVDEDGNPIESVITESNGSSQAALAGAVFKLYQTAAAAEAENDELLYTNDVFQGTVTSDAQGLMTIQGLDVGDYYLKEITAPKGYIRSTKVWHINVAATIEEEDTIEYDEDGREIKYSVPVLKSYTITIDDGDTTYPGSTFSTTITGSDPLTSTSKGDVSTSIANTKGVELPSTGGMGTTLFYIIGAILVVGAGVVLITRRRMSAN